MAEAPAATFPEAFSETPTDELMERYARLGLTRKLAEALASDLILSNVIDADRVRGKAVNALLGAESADVIKLILFRVFESPKPRLMVGCLLLACGIKPIGTPSMRALALQQNVSPEHVSNGVQEWQTILQLGRVEFQKSPEAIASYKLHHRSNGKQKA